MSEDTLPRDDGEDGEQGIGDLAEAELDIFQKQLKTPSEVNHLLLTSESLNLHLWK